VAEALINLSKEGVIIFCKGSSVTISLLNVIIKPEFKDEVLCWDWVHLNPFKEENSLEVFLLIGSKEDFDEYIQKYKESFACFSLMERVGGITALIDCDNSNKQAWLDEELAKLDTLPMHQWPSLD